MNPLPPLPFVDGAFLIDNSTLEHYQSCRRLYELQDVRKYSLVAPRAGRNFGSGLHAGLKARYALCGNQPVQPNQEATVNDAISQWFETNPAPVDDFRDAAHCHRIMREYNAHYGKEPFTILSVAGVPLVERSFALPLGNVQNIPIIWMGRIDLAIRFDGHIWTFDHKTAFQYGRDYDADKRTNGGQLGYVWALQQILGERVVGYIINGIRVRKPSRAAKYGDAGGPAPIDATDFVRDQFPMVDNDLIDEWRDDTLALINDLFIDHDFGRFPKSRKSCATKYGPCDMFEVCTAHRGSRQQILDSAMFQPNVWSPLNQETTE